MNRTDLENELRELIVEALAFEDIEASDIDSSAPLFGDEGLGLDSIDALELGVALRKKYNIQIDSVTEEVKHFFYSISSLAQFIANHQAELV